jgi:hypothetical protein
MVFTVSKIEQLHNTLDALEVGLLPTDLAISAVYATVEGFEPHRQSTEGVFLDAFQYIPISILSLSYK